MGNCDYLPLFFYFQGSAKKKEEKLVSIRAALYSYRKRAQKQYIR